VIRLNTSPKKNKPKRLGAYRHDARERIFMSEQTLEQVVGEVPEVAPVTDQPVVVDNEQTEPVTPTEQPSEEEQHKTRVQKRIDQLTRDKYELKARL
jgi:hypothetical protein